MSLTETFRPAPLGGQPPITGPLQAPPTDWLAILPEAASDRLQKLRLRSDTAHRTIPAFSEVHDASMERLAADNRLKQLLAHASQGGFALPEADLRVTVQQRTVDRLTAELKRIQELTQVRTEAWQSASAALQAVEIWLRDGKPANTTLAVVETPLPKLDKNEGLLDAVANRRRKAQELRDELDRVENAPLTASECRAAMRKQIEALAQSGQPDVTPLVSRGEAITFPRERVKSEVDTQERTSPVADCGGVEHLKIRPDE
jgi:hypothetical protein